VLARIICKSWGFAHPCGRIPSLKASLFGLKIFILTMQKSIRQLAADIQAQEHQVKAAVELLDGGATVPFIARYRKEATGGLDDIQLRELEYRLGYLRELQERRQAILKSIDEQGKLTPQLRAAIEQATTKQDLEDLYLPYKTKRRTKGQMAREAGIEPLADALFANPSLVPADEAAAYVKAEKNEAGDDFTTVQAVLDGVRDILSERWAEDAALVQTAAPMALERRAVFVQAGQRQG